MRFSKEIAIMLVLASLLLSAIGAAVYLYMENEKTKKENSQLVMIYVAKKDIKKNQLITSEVLAKQSIQKKYVLTKPLQLNDILNKFAKVPIYKNETFIAEKLVKSLDYQDEIKNLPFKYNSYNFGFGLFQNPNYSLLKGDTLKIASVYPKSKKRENLSFKVQYVANNIKVLGFLEKGKIVEKPFRKVKQKVKTKKKQKQATYETVTVFADEVILDVPNKIILNLLNDYNKGKQLWMVKTVEAVDKKEDAKKVKIADKKDGKKVKVAKKSKPRVYKHIMYVPKNVVSTKRAVIEYIDKKIPQKSSEAIIRYDIQAQCRATDKYLIGKSRKVYLRSAPSIKAKVVKRVYRNYILPYTRAVNDKWFELCDGSFVHKNEANYISNKNVKRFLSGTAKTKK